MFSNLTFKESKRVFKIIGPVFLFLFVFHSVAMGGIFGMGEYPGGELRAVFKIEEPNSDAPARRYVMTIEQKDEGYNVTEKVFSPGRALEDVSTAFGASGGAGAAGSRYEEDDTPNIDISPLANLDDINVELEPGKKYFFTGGAKLVTEERKTISGVEVITGTYVHPEYRNQKVNIALADRETRDLLLFPTLFERVEKEEVTMRIELVEFSYQK